ncbi:hypothetical protein PHMEG_00031518 [Phytophthora megakarya]|uniref:ZSWIM1/3 RNaseH-like domain-containing protein n=1 Tax=Phytophthora megakarya TaxID=4795 RepID=A0A225V0A5_9STRA|nr:hypothetical protein PHMEG_00031518 [Phytophthora megakarya]
MDIAIQTRSQREIFRRWGDTLDLDWMHNCTNLGFRSIRSLVATIRTGRSVSVLDFLCLDQQKETLLAVLTWSKEKTPSWSRLISLVNKKDFTD